MSVISLTDYLADSDCPELCDNDGFTLISTDEFYHMEASEALDKLGIDECLYHLDHCWGDTIGN